MDSSDPLGMLKKLMEKKRMEAEEDASKVKRPKKKKKSSRPRKEPKVIKVLLIERTCLLVDGLSLGLKSFLIFPK